MTSYDPMTALIVVDCQNDFAAPEGSLFVNGAEEVISEVNRHVISAVSVGALVVYTQDWHPESTPHFEKDGGIWPVHCVAGSWGAAFHPRLVVAGPGVRKGSNGEDGYSGFTMRDPETGEETPTELHEVLQGSRVTGVVVVGLALDYCVKETALDAAKRFDTTLLADGTRPVNLSTGDGARAVAEMVGAGVRIA